MNYYVLKIAYDGTDYCGWQVQPDCPTITNRLQDSFKDVFGHEATIVGASRTDAGVHALGQVAVCRTPFFLEADRLRIAWNNRLPADILIRKLHQLDSSFHPQRNVRQKTYYYHFFLERPLPFVARYGWYINARCNMEKLQQALEVFCGTHDFRSFCTGDECGDNTIRNIDLITIEYLSRFKVYRIIVRGQSFLRYMIRRVVGASLAVAMRSDITVSDLQEVFAAKDPEHYLLNAPAKGLLLYKISYEKESQV